MQKDIEQAGEWQAVWSRKGGFVDSVIDLGRTIYNLFFRRILRRYITKDTRMLELGSGRASLSLSICKEIKSLYGVDISDVALKQASASAESLGVSNAKFIIGDCTKLNIDDKFDFVWSQGLIEHFDDPTLVAREHYKALVPGGVVLISVPYKYSYHTIWYKMSRPKLLRWLWLWEGTEQRFFNHKELSDVGTAITPHFRVFLMQPFPLGIIFLEMRKPSN